MAAGGDSKFGQSTTLMGSCFLIVFVVRKVPYRSLPENTKEANDPPKKKFFIAFLGSLGDLLQNRKRIGSPSILVAEISQF